MYSVQSYVNRRQFILCEKWNVQWQCKIQLMRKSKMAVIRTCKIIQNGNYATYFIKSNWRNVYVNLGECVRERVSQSKSEIVGFMSCHSNDKAFCKIYTWTLFNELKWLGSIWNVVACVRIFRIDIFQVFGKSTKHFEVNELNGLFRVCAIKITNVLELLVEFPNFHMWMGKSKVNERTWIKTSVVWTLIPPCVSQSAKGRTHRNVAKYIKYINIGNKKESHR